MLIGGQDFHMYHDVIQAIAAKAEDFWVNHVLKDIPPAPINVDDIKKLYARDNGELRNLKGQITELQEQEKAVASRLIMTIADKTGMTIGAYKAQNATRFSSTAFKKDHPDLFEEYAKTTSTRILRLA